MSSELTQPHPVGAALVVGGGIGGMQAALDLANGGIKVYLAERGPAIGGVMAQLDKTFPTNDCAMCTMAPRLVEIGRHKDIDILTLSEVERVEGLPGNFTVSIKKQPRFVDATKCTGCGACTTECPVALPSEFDQGLGERKAIYRRFPQAVPNIFTITRRGIAPCQAGCPIHQSAQGYVTLIAQGRFDEALQVILRDNPIPSICGRICTHPCTAACTRTNVDDPVNVPALKRFVTDRCPDYKLPQPTVPERPEKIAIVGSGPAGLLCAYQLRQKGYSTTIFEALPVAGGMLAVGIPSFRLPRPLLNAELDRMRAIGIEILLDTPVGRRGEIFPIDPAEIPAVKLDDFSLHQLPISNLLRELQETCGVEVRVLACQTGPLPEQISQGLSKAVSDAVPRAAEWLVREYFPRATAPRVDLCQASA
jgi:heterodisulfide reductase subunit A